MLCRPTPQERETMKRHWIHLILTAVIAASATIIVLSLLDQPTPAPEEHYIVRSIDGYGSLYRYETHTGKTWFTEADTFRWKEIAGPPW